MYGPIKQCTSIDIPLTLTPTNQRPVLDLLLPTISLHLLCLRLSLSALPLLGRPVKSSVPSHSALFGQRSACSDQLRKIFCCVYSSVCASVAMHRRTHGGALGLVPLLLFCSAAAGALQQQNPAVVNGLPETIPLRLLLGNAKYRNPQVRLTNPHTIR